MDEQKVFYGSLVEQLYKMKGQEPPFDCKIVVEGLMALGHNEAVDRLLRKESNRPNPFATYLKLLFQK